MVIAPHGHGSGGKNMTAGRRDIPAVADALDRYNGAYAEHFAQAGLMVFAPDARALASAANRWGK